jgi:predicted nucleic acid-binding protein
VTLIDSNIIIYAAKPEYSNLRQFIVGNVPAVSAVSYVEVLGYPRLSDEEHRHFEAFFASATALPISDEVLRIRQRQRMLLGDALVAGTAPVHGLTLVTRNTKDFDGVVGLSLLNPFLAEGAGAIGLGWQTTRRQTLNDGYEATRLAQDGGGRAGRESNLSGRDSGKPGRAGACAAANEGTKS